MAAEFDCILANWGLVTAPEFGTAYLYGDIYEDTLTIGKHPFPNGKSVQTTEVSGIKNNIATTKSGSRYLLMTDPPE